MLVTVPVLTSISFSIGVHDLKPVRHEKMIMKAITFFIGYIIRNLFIISKLLNMGNTSQIII
jgi:hypothetical protein